MYSQYGDTQYPHGPELGPIRGQMPVDPSGGPARYPYMSYYGSKGPDGAQLAAVMSQRPPYGGDFSNMANPEAMYNPGWNSMMPGPGYMGPHGGKPGPYGMQGMGSYPGAAPGYPGPPHQFSSGAPYPYGGSQSPMPANQASLLQQQQALASRHRFTPPTAEGGSSTGSGVGDGAAAYPGGMPGGVLPQGAGSGGAGPPWPSQGLPHGGGGRGYGDQSSPAPATSGSGGGAWHGPPYQSSDFPPGGPSTPGSSRVLPPSSSSNSSKLKAQDKGTKSVQSPSSQPLSQKQQMELLSPHNSELPKSSSISSLRDALLATTSTTSSSQQYASYSSPRMVEHQPSPMTPEAGPGMISPQISVTGATRQDSQLSAGGQSLEQDSSQQSYSRQNSAVPGKGDTPNTPHPPEEGIRASPLQVESILGIKGDQPIDSPLSNSMREGGGSGSNVNSPHTQSPLGGGGMLNPNIAAGMQDGQSPAPGRPELLGFPAKSPSFRSIENQPSPLTEDGKTARKQAMSPVDRSHPSISSQYDGDQKRKDFLDSLFSYLEKEGIQLVRLPMICKSPFDLYKIFNSVQQHGGYSNVTEKRLWRDVVKTAYSATSGLTSGALRNVQQYYLKLLLPYECHLNNQDLPTCLVKLDNSLSRHTSLSSPCSQKSSDSDSKDRVNHLPDNMSKFDRNNSMDGRVNGETMCGVPPGSTPTNLLDGEHMVERVSSQSGNGVHLNNNTGGSGVASVDPAHQPQQQPQRRGGGGVNATKSTVNSLNHEEVGFSEDSRDSMDTYSQAALAEPLPEMSVQDAESVLGMSPLPYPPTQEGPTTPSAGVPSPLPFPSSHFPHGPGAPPPSGHQPGTPGSVGTPTSGRGGGGGAAGGGGSQDYNVEMNEMGGASTPGLSGNTPANPPSYPPPYPSMDVPGYHPSYGPGNYPNFNSSFHRQYNVPPDFHPGMPSPMMRSPYPSTRSPYSTMPPMAHRNPMDYRGYHPHMMHQGMGAGGMRDPSMFPGAPHGMSPDWHWHQQQQQHQQQRQQMASISPHLQQSHMYQRIQQQQQLNAAMRHQQQQAAMAAMQQAGSRGSPNLSSGSPGMDHGKPQWHDPSKNLSSKVFSEKVTSSPKMPPKHLESSSMEGKALSKSSEAEGLKRGHPDWSNCVEGTKPQLIKRRKLYGYNCGHVEPWRLMMSLKSGILADSTWALDTLTILLHDDSTFGYFNLKHHHSLLDTIVNHFKVILSAIFDIEFEDNPRYMLDSKKSLTLSMKKEEGDVSVNATKVGSSVNRNVSVSVSKEKEDGVTTELLVEACRLDYDVLLELTSSTQGDKESKGDKSEKSSGLKIPVANVYRSEDIKLGKSDDLSHICIPTMEDSFFPKEAVDLDIMPEEDRLRLDRDSLLQRIDQTPVSVLLQRELLLNQIPLHRFGRLSHSPRRRDRNFFGRRESQSVEEKQSGGGGADGKDNTADESNTKNPTGRRESQCKSPPMVDTYLSRKSTSSSPDKKESSPSPVMREESEVYRRENLPLWSISPTREQMESRCKCVSNILRSLTFVPGNDVEFCQHPGILIILGELLMLHHHHLVHSKEKRRGLASQSNNNALDTDNGFDVRKVDDQQFPPAKDYWWWECLDVLREDTLVILANISGQLDLSVFPEKISYPIINGLLHWLVCPSSMACDPLPDTSRVYSQSPQRLVVETLAKMTISEVNVDLILATPPLMRLDLLFSQLGQMIGQKKYPVVRQFALVLLSNLAQGNESSSRLIGQQKMVMSLLLESLEVAEHMTCLGQGTVEGGYGKEDPTSLSVAMLRRAASTLHYLSTVPANRTAFLPYRDRILYLATSQYVEPSVSSILMDMLYEFGKL